MRWFCKDETGSNFTHKCDAILSSAVVNFTPSQSEFIIGNAVVQSTTGFVVGRLWSRPAGTGLANHLILSMRLSKLCMAAATCPLERAPFSNLFRGSSAVKLLIGSLFPPSVTRNFFGL